MTTLCREPGHYCTGCRPERFKPTDGPRNEGHLAARWGDRSRGDWRLLYEGVDRTDDAWESQLGPNGWVYIYVRDGHPDGQRRVHCPGHVCACILHGEVRLVYPSRVAS